MAEQGVVTIMHTDVAGSTELAVRVGDDDARTVLGRTKQMVLEQVETGGGRVVDSVGDATMSTFDSTRQAIACAIAIQRSLDEHERAHPGDTVPVRIGLNVGEVLEKDGHPFGATVNAGARVMSKADGGQIFVSEMVHRLAGSIPGVEYRGRGRHSFKGWDERWRLYEIVWDRPPAPKPPRPPKPKRRRRAGRRGFVGAVVIVAAGAALAALFITRGGDGPGGLRRIDPRSVGLLDPTSLEIVKEFPVGPKPDAIAVGLGSVWVANAGNHTVTRVHPATGQTSTIPVDGVPTGLTVAGGAVWAATLEGGLIRIDPQFDRAGDPMVVNRPQVGTFTAGVPAVVAAGGALWVSAPPTTLVRVGRLGSGRPQSLIPDSGVDGPLAAGGGHLWTASYSQVTPLDPITGRPVGGSIRVSGPAVALAYGAGAAWAVSDFKRVLQRIDPALLAVTSTSPTGRNPTAVAVGQGAVWVTNGSDGTVLRVGLAGSKATTVSVGGSPAAVAVSGKGVWVTSE